MNQSTQNLINQGLGQYRLEIQNKELLTQINVAEKTIADQNQHIENIYAGMSWTVSVLGVMLTIFGIIIPVAMAYFSIKNKIELDKIKNNVNDFITNKFTEWEKQNIDDALDRYLNEDLDWASYHTILKHKSMPFEHMKKIFDIAVKEGSDSPRKFYRRLECLAYHVFDEQKNDETINFKKIRDLIINSEYFYTFYCDKAINFFENIKKLDKGSQKRNIDYLLNYADKLQYILDNLKQHELIDLLDEDKFISSIISRKDAPILSTIQNEKSLVDKLIKKINLSDVRRLGTREYSFQLILWNGKTVNISEKSYMGQKFKDVKFFEP